MGRGRAILWLVGCIALGFGAQRSDADQELMIYPAKGQTPEQQEKDAYQCYKWASANSGFDPMAPPPDFSADTPVSAAPQAPPAGGAIRGAAGGAARGAVIGEIAQGDPGKGAAIGAGVGAVRGARRQAAAQKHQQQQAQAQAQQAQAEVETKRAAYEAQRAQYNKAKKTCLQGRGYTVN